MQSYQIRALSRGENIPCRLTIIQTLHNMLKGDVTHLSNGQNLHDNDINRGVETVTFVNRPQWFYVTKGLRTLQGNIMNFYELHIVKRCEFTKNQLFLPTRGACTTSPTHSGPRTKANENNVPLRKYSLQVLKRSLRPVFFEIFLVSCGEDERRTKGKFAARRGSRVWLLRGFVWSLLLFVPK